MAAPTNQAATTAIDIGTLPITEITQTVDDSGTTYTVWYKYTAVQGEWVIGLFGFGDETTYLPTTNIYIGPASAPVAHPASGGISALNRPVNISVEAGTTYYFQFVTNGGNPTPAVLTINCSTAPCEVAPAGSILVPNDTTNMAATLISSVDGDDNHILGYIAKDTSGADFPSTEQGDVASNGFFLIENGTNAADNTVKMYNPDGTFFQTITFPSVGALAIRTIKTSITWDWAVGWQGGGGDTAQVVFQSSSFSVARSDVVTLPLAGLTAVAVSNNENLIYYSGQSSSLNSEIKVWDRSLNAEQSDLVADFGGTFLVRDILVMSNDDLIVLYYEAASKTTTVVRYNSSGSEVRRDSLGTGFDGERPRMTYDKNAVDSSYWIMLHTSSTGVTTFKNIRLSDGVVIAEIEAVNFSGGASIAPDVANAQRYGVSPSCPVMVIGPTTSGIQTCPLYAGGGIYKIAADKTNDTIWVDTVAETTQVNKIPDPGGKMGHIGG